MPIASEKRNLQVNPWAVWRIRQVVVAVVLALLLILVWPVVYAIAWWLSYFYLLVIGRPPLPRSLFGSIVHSAIRWPWLPVLIVIAASLLEWLPGTRRPKRPAHCDSCDYDLRALRPEDGIGGITCPECGHSNPFRRAMRRSLEQTQATSPKEGRQAAP